MIERRHCSFLQIIEQSSRLFYLLICWIFVMIGNALSDLSVDEVGSAVAEATGSATIAGVCIGILAVIAILFVIMWLRWKNTWISAVDDVLYYETGILGKKKVSIPFSKINTIEVGRNIFERICGVCRLKIDTGAISGTDDSRSEMDLVFSEKDGEMLRSYILSRNAQNESVLRSADISALTVQNEPKWILRARFGDFFLYGLTSSGVWKLFVLFVAAFAFIAQLSPDILSNMLSFILPYAETAYNTVSRFSLLIIAAGILGAFLVLALLTNIWTILVSCIKFYGFRTAREGDSIVVRYGLINLKNYTLPVRNIHAVVVKQTFMQQLLGRCSVEMVSVGYGNEKTENSLLFPIIKRSQLEWLMNEILPEYSLDAQMHGSTKKSIRFTILRPIFWNALLLAGGYIILRLLFDDMTLYLCFAILLIVVVIVASIMSYFHNAIGWNDRVVAISSGGLMRHTYYIRTDAVQSVASSSGIFQRRHGIVHYRVDYHAPAMRSIAIAPHLAEGYATEIADVVDRARIY